MVDAATKIAVVRRAFKRWRADPTKLVSDYAEVHQMVTSRRVVFETTSLSKTTIWVRERLTISTFYE